MELIIKDFKATEIITFNYEELKKELQEKLHKYSNVTYDDSAISLAKKDKANLNKLKTAIEDKRKEIKAQCLEPYNDFEVKVKDIVNMIDKPVQQIDVQIKEYDLKVKEEKRAEIQKHFDLVVDDLTLFIKLDSIFNPKWLNVTYSMSNIFNEIDITLGKIREDLAVINGLQSEFEIELKNIYLNTMDLSQVLRKKSELEERKKALEELEQKKREAEMLKKQNTGVDSCQEITKDTQSNIYSIEKQTSVKNDLNSSEEEKYQVDFRVWATRKQMHNLKVFMAENNIKYGRVE